MKRISLLIILFSCNADRKLNYEAKSIEALILANDTVKVFAVKNTGTHFDFRRSGKKESIEKTYYYDSAQHLYYLFEERLYNYDLNPSRKDPDTFLFTNSYYIKEKLAKMECVLKSSDKRITKASYYFKGYRIIFQIGTIPGLSLKPSDIALRNNEVDVLQYLLEQ